MLKNGVTIYTYCSAKHDEQLVMYAWFRRYAVDILEQYTCVM